MSSLQTSGSVLAAVTLSLLLLGCAAEPVSSPAPVSGNSAVAAEETVEPEPETEVEPVVTLLPSSCEEIFPAAEFGTVHEAFQSFGSEGAEIKLEMMLGPQAWAALSASDLKFMCLWGIPQSDGGGTVGIGVIEEQVKTDLITAFQESVYTETTLPGTDASFLRTQSANHPWLSEIVFDGDVLIAAVSTIGGDFANRAHQSVSTLNPGLGDS